MAGIPLVLIGGGDVYWGIWLIGDDKKKIVNDNDIDNLRGREKTFFRLRCWGDHYVRG